MKKSTMIRALQDTKKANINFKDGFIIFFGVDVFLISHNEKSFCCSDNEVLKKVNFKYSEVKSVEVFA